MNSNQNFSVEKVVVIPGSGTEILRVIREAAILSLTEYRTVEFRFNDTVVIVTPQAIVDLFHAQWAAERAKQGIRT